MFCLCASVFVLVLEPYSQCPLTPVKYCLGHEEVMHTHIRLVPYNFSS